MDGEKIKDLGWANDGGETERIIDETHAKCVSMGHRRSDIDVGPPHREQSITGASPVEGPVVVSHLHSGDAENLRFLNEHFVSPDVVFVSLLSSRLSHSTVQLSNRPGTSEADSPTPFHFSALRIPVDETEQKWSGSITSVQRSVNRFGSPSSPA